MSHVIGDAVRRRVAGMTVERSVHSPLRYYYGSRNHVVMSREFVVKEPVWVLKLSLSKCRELVMMFLFDDDKLAKLKHAMRGYVDGITGRRTVPSGGDRGARKSVADDK